MSSTPLLQYRPTSMVCTHVQYSLTSIQTNIHGLYTRPVLPHIHGLYTRPVLPYIHGLYTRSVLPYIHGLYTCPVLPDFHGLYALPVLPDFHGLYASPVRPDLNGLYTRPVLPYFVQTHLAAHPRFVHTSSTPLLPWFVPTSNTPLHPRFVPTSSTPLHPQFVHTSSTPLHPRFVHTSSTPLHPRFVHTSSTPLHPRFVHTSSTPLHPRFVHTSSTPWLQYKPTPTPCRSAPSGCTSTVSTHVQYAVTSTVCTHVQYALTSTVCTHVQYSLTSIQTNTDPVQIRPIWLHFHSLYARPVLPYINTDQHPWLVHTSSTPLLQYKSTSTVCTHVQYLLTSIQTNIHGLYARPVLPYINTDQHPWFVHMSSTPLHQYRSTSMVSTHVQYSLTSIQTNIHGLYTRPVPPYFNTNQHPRFVRTSSTPLHQYRSTSMVSTHVQYSLTSIQTNIHGLYTRPVLPYFNTDQHPLFVHTSSTPLLQYRPTSTVCTHVQYSLTSYRPIWLHIHGLYTRPVRPYIHGLYTRPVLHYFNTDPSGCTSTVCTHVQYSLTSMVCTLVQYSITLIQTHLAAHPRFIHTSSTPLHPRFVHTSSTPLL